MSYQVWYRRNLPHWQPGGVPFFITWRLSGSLPAVFIAILPNKSVLRKTLARRMNTVIGPSMLSNDCLRAVMMNCTKWTGHVGSHNLRSRLLYVMPCIRARKNDCIVCMPIL